MYDQEIAASRNAGLQMAAFYSAARTEMPWWLAARLTLAWATSEDRSSVLTVEEA